MITHKDLFFGTDFNPTDTGAINFLETRFHDLSPFSAHEIAIDGVVYKTAEHAYQALRVVPDARAEVREARSPLEAWRIGQSCKVEGKLVPNFDKHRFDGGYFSGEAGATSRYCDCAADEWYTRVAQGL